MPHTVSADTKTIIHSPEDISWCCCPLQLAEIRKQHMCKAWSRCCVRLPWQCISIAAFAACSAAALVGMIATCHQGHPPVLWTCKLHVPATTLRASWCYCCLPRCCTVA